MRTNRSELIKQLRYAIGELERPNHEDDTVCFDVLGCGFEIELDHLDSEFKEGEHEQL